MARFCTSCGSPVEESIKFCPKCGVQLGTPPAPAPAAGPAPAPASGTMGGPVAAPAPTRKGGSGMKIILIIVAVFLVLGILGAAAGIYLVYRTRQKVSTMIETAKTESMRKGSADIHVGKGGAGSEAAEAASQDVPPYPNSTATEEGGTFSLGGQGAVSGQEYETSDSVEQVLAFYKQKLGSKIVIHEAEGNAMFTLATDNGLTTVTITRDEQEGKTKINISRIGK
jgi:hypothetical protein